MTKRGRGAELAFVAGLLFTALGCSARSPAATGAPTGAAAGRAQSTGGARPADSPPREPVARDPALPVLPSEYASTIVARRDGLIERGLQLGAEDVGYYMDVQAARLQQAGGTALRLTRLGSSVILELTGQLNFEIGSARLASSAVAALSDVAKVLVDYRLTIVSIEGHTDDSGNAASNRTLSEERAAAVARQLVGKGVEAERLVVVGYGAERPVADNATKVGQEANRRVVLRVDALRR